MSLASRIEKLRKKPPYVRERFLLVVIAIAAPILITIWFATFDTGFRMRGSAFASDILGHFSNPFSNPTYQTTFTQPQLLDSPQAPADTAAPAPAPAAPVSH